MLQLVLDLLLVERCPLDLEHIQSSRSICLSSTRLQLQINIDLLSELFGLLRLRIGKAGSNLLLILNDFVIFLDILRKLLLFKIWLILIDLLE